MLKFTRYANLSQDERESILEAYEAERSMTGDSGQAAAVAAVKVFGLSDRQWNSGVGSDAFAAVCAVLVMQGTFGEV